MRRRGGKGQTEGQTVDEWLLVMGLSDCVSRQ